MASEQPQIPVDLSNSEADCLKGLSDMFTLRLLIKGKRWIASRNSSGDLILSVAQGTS